MPLPRPPRPRPAPALRAAVACLFGAIAGAQAPAQPGPDPSYNPGPVEFDPKPLRVESMNLSLLLPVGATAQTATVGTLVTVRVQPAPEAGQKTGESTWIMDIQTVGEIAPDPAAGSGQAPGAIDNATMADRAIREIQRSYGKVDAQGRVVETQAAVLYREQNLTIRRGADSARPWRADRFYIAFPEPSGKGRVVRGTTICQVAPSRFIAFTLFVKEADFRKARQVYEAVVASAAIDDPAEASLARANLIQAGKQALAGLDQDAYRQIIASRAERWDRLFKPGPDRGDSLAVERGYRRTRVWIGRKGEMNPGRDPAKWNKAEETEGYLVSVEYRLLSDPENPPPPGQTWTLSDATAVYFMSLDGGEETWSIRQTSRGPKSAPGTSKELGARIGNKMEVTIEGPGVAPTTIRPLFNAEGYISQVQTFLLPQLLVRAAAPLDYGFYAYQSATQRIQLRTDSLRQPEGRPGAWELRTRLNEDAPAVLSVLNDQGEVLRSELPDGWTWEPTTGDALASLWQRKGLPLK